MNDIGEQLEALCCSATRQLILVAPFVKVTVLERLLQHVLDGVEIHCVTRWHPAEIAAGVSDVDVWPLVASYAKATLWLRADLHAKYYRADERCLLGSANLTAAALGWGARSNYELLAPYPFNTRLQQFEQSLWDHCVKVDSSIYAHARRVADLVPSKSVTLQPRAFTQEMATWLPSLRDPAKLFPAYQQKWETLTSATREAAQLDLAVFTVPAGLDREQFEAFVSTLLLQMPMIQRVDNFLSKPRRFGAVKAMLKRLLTETDTYGRDPTEAWQTLMRWLLHFLPERYEYSVPHYSEVMHRVQP